MASATIHPAATLYLQRVHDLFGNVRAWMEEIDAKAIVHEGPKFPMNEEEIGEYDAPSLYIESPLLGKVVLEPRGQFIATEGGVRISGKFGHENLVYLNNGWQPATGWAWAKETTEKNWLQILNIGVFRTCLLSVTE